MRGVIGDAAVAERAGELRPGPGRERQQPKADLPRPRLRISGVVDDWNPVPHFYDLNGGGAYAKGEPLFLPLRTAQNLDLPEQGGMRCWTTSQGGDISSSNCVRLQFWVQLYTRSDWRTYFQFLEHYSDQQRRLGRFERPANARLRGIQEWLDSQQAFPRAVALQAYLAFAFLGICLVNSIALVLVTYLRRGNELAIRRAMGATRRNIFAQLALESISYGLASGLLGLVVLSAGLFIIREQPAPYAYLAHADPVALTLTLTLGVLSSVFAALFPAWHACRNAPAHALKIQ